VNKQVKGPTTMSNSIIQNPEPVPFESYPYRGRRLLGRVTGDNCRHGYGLKFMRLTGQTKCAYCGLDLVTTYENWLTMALDHVVPHSTCLTWELSEDWREDYSNRVLCCATCNTFGNRYTPEGFQSPSTLEEFYDLRDAIFVERRGNIINKHKEEHAFFDQNPWVK
jgi:5-methylcytosine-specific restriction endonuclease McrA